MVGEHPETLAVVPEGIPDELKQFPQWVAWRWEWRSGLDGISKWTKPPIDAKNGHAGSHSNPATWAPFAAALAFYRRCGCAGIGLVLSEGLGLVGIDLDGCRDATTGDLADWARRVVDSFASYATVSPSGTGVRIFVWGALPGPGRNRRPIEIYAEKRFLTITGVPVDHAPLPIVANQDAIDKIYAYIVKDTAAGDALARDIWRSPCSAGAGDLRQRVACGRIRRETLALLDSPGVAGDSVVDMRLACGIIGAGLTAHEALTLILGSIRGASAADRKGARYAPDYWRRTVEAAARHVGPVVQTPAGFRVRKGGTAAPSAAEQLRRLAGL